MTLLTFTIKVESTLVQQNQNVQSYYDWNMYTTPAYEQCLKCDNNDFNPNLLPLQ